MALIGTPLHLEIGHNMGLAHSGQISEYDDESGMVCFLLTYFYVA